MYLNLLKRKNKIMKILLIDDLALRGWKQVLEKAVTQTPIEIAENIKDAKERLKEKYDLIFLDMRLGEKDHKNADVKEFGGFKLLKEIKSDFRNTNFSTPIILITASNKIWNIDMFKEHGVDFYYIKEHPNYVYSKEYSMENLRQLQKNFEKCIEINQNRNKIWILCNEIISKIEKHSYFKSQDKRYIRVKERIFDKIRLGYYYLFKRTTEIEEEKLLANNESIAFVVFWSILEEIVKGYTDINATWKGEKYEWTGNWKFRNGEDFILQGVNKTYQDEEGNSKTYQEEKHINLSSQVHALLSCYISDEQKQKEIREKFVEINKYRNQIDYIHSRVRNIFTQKLIDPKQTEECFEKNEEVLHFIISILENCQ
jgi:response regulator receiver domain